MCVCVCVFVVVVVVVVFVGEGYVLSHSVSVCKLNLKPLRLKEMHIIACVTNVVSIAVVLCGSYPSEVF